MKAWLLVWQHDDETSYAYEWGGIFGTSYTTYTWIAQKVRLCAVSIPCLPLGVPAVERQI